MEEKRLAAALRKGERRALDQAVETYAAYLSAVVWRTLGPNATREDTEELVSDAFLALWRHRESLDPERGIKGYLAAAARNGAVDRLRAMGTPPLPLDEETARPAPGPEAEVERREFAAALLSAVEELPPTDRALVEGFYYEGRRLGELARELGLSGPAAKTRLHRARNTLRKNLTKGGSADEADGWTLG